MHLNRSSNGRIFTVIPSKPTVMASALNPSISLFSDLDFSQPRSLSHPPRTLHSPPSKLLTSLPPKPNSSNSKFPTPPYVYNHPSALLLEMCSDMKELIQILPLIIKTGLENELPFQTKLVSLFSRFGHMNQARIVFQRVNSKIDELWHSMLKGHAKNSSLEEGLAFFCKMKHAEVQHVVYNFTYLLKSCGDNSDLKRGRELHGQLICNGFGSNVFAMTAVMNMYAKCRLVDDAHKVFDRMPQRDLVAWNAVIAGYAQNGLAKRALELVGRMQDQGHCPDSITLVTLLPACADIGYLRMGKSIHGYVLRAGLFELVNIATALVDMYSKCGSIETSRLVFDRMPERNVVSWNSLLDGYAQSGNSVEALRIFRKMQEKRVRVTEVTMMAALHACADSGDLEQGRYVHEKLVQVGLGSNVSVMNSLIAMYSKCKRVDIASEIFKNLHEKTLVSWNAMISCYAQNGHPNEALNLFCKMQHENIRPDSFTLVSVIPAYAHLSVLRQSKWIHGHVIRSCLHRNVFVMTALIDMYAKSGGVEIARKLFDMIDEKHITMWNAMIDGYGTHGLGEEAISLFSQMQQSNTKPNDITFICVLSACSHSGLVDQGREYFNSMKRDYSIEPAMDHYGSMVDILGRAGLLDEAWDFINTMPIEPGISVFGAMLGACKIHKNVELGEKAAKRLFELEPREGGYHVLLANIYATASMWEDVSRVRSTMEKKGLQKMPGLSMIELGNEVHSFYSGSTTHPQSEKIYGTLEALGTDIKAAGYVPDTDSIHDVEDDVKEQLLNSHSEKLAIAFGLINTSPGTTIQIRKNLRVCRDCHNATKFISKVTDREIIVRDMHRFHHFKDGYCSCGDYW